MGGPQHRSKPGVGMDTCIPPPASAVLASRWPAAVQRSLPFSHHGAVYCHAQDATRRANAWAGRPNGRASRAGGRTEQASRRTRLVAGEPSGRAGDGASQAGGRVGKRARRTGVRSSLPSCSGRDRGGWGRGPGQAGGLASRAGGPASERAERAGGWRENKRTSVRAGSSYGAVFRHAQDAIGRARARAGRAGPTDHQKTHSVRMYFFTG